MNILGAEEEAYSEIMVLDTHGDVVISTIPGREGSGFLKQLFFERGLLGFYAGFPEEPSFGAENLTIATPILDPNGQGVRGVLVLRSNAALMKEVMENTTGSKEAETYLVDTHFHPVTGIRATVSTINTKAALEALRQSARGVKAIYPNYADQPVLGYYKWFRPLEVAVIAEVPVSFVALTSFRTLAGTALLSLFIAVVVGRSRCHVCPHDF